MNKHAKNYLLYGFIILLFLELLTESVCILLGKNFHSYGVVAFCFQIVCVTLYWLSWKKISVSSPKNLPLLYMVASGLRLILAAFVVLVYMFINRNSENLIAFSLIFTIYYMVILIYDTYFFVSVEKKKIK